MKTKLILFLFIHFLSQLLFSQQDSIKYFLQQLKAVNSSEQKIHLNIRLADAYMNINTDTSFHYFRVASRLHANNFANNKTEIKLLLLQASLLMKTGNLIKADSIYNTVSTTYGNEINALLLGQCFVQQGTIKDYQGDDLNAVKLYNKAYFLFDSINATDGKAECLNNMGIIFHAQGETDKGIEYLEKSLELRKKSSNTSEIAGVLENLGSMYVKKGDTAKANEYFNKGLKIYRNNNNNWGIAYALKNKAKLFLLNGNYHETLQLCNMILTQYTSKNDSSGISMINSIMAEAYLCNGEINKSIEFAEKAYSIAQNIRLAIRSYEALNVLRKVHKAAAHYKLALMYQERFTQMKDSFSNNTIVKETLKQRLEHENLLDKLAHEKIVLLKESENKRKNVIIFFTGISLLLIIIFTIMLYNRFKLIKTQKIIIDKQKLLVEIKQKEIIDSINYAKRIQYTLLAHDELLKENLPDYFTLFNPKDIVSGDFYWATKHHNKFYLAVCDSTGHGVPGAFMSLLNIGFLNEAINEKEIDKPNEIFDYVRMKLTNTISKEGQKDGFDGILVCFDKATNKITYAAANNAPIIIKKKSTAGSVEIPISELVEAPSDRMPVGVGERKENFTLQTIEAKPGEMLYLYTDGFADQFGGPKGKKFKYKQLNGLLVSNYHLSMLEQKHKLNSVFENWKGNLEQVDDVCIIGIRL